MDQVAALPANERADLFRETAARKGVANLDLLRRVADHKGVFFRSGWANYEGATGGALRLVPHEELETLLRRDYDSMQDMFFVAPASFDKILAELEQLEKEVNAQLTS